MLPGTKRIIRGPVKKCIKRIRTVLIHYITDGVIHIPVIVAQVKIPPGIVITFYYSISKYRINA